MGSCKRLYYLSDAEHLTKTKNSFGIGKITASCIVKNFTEMIFQHLGLEFIKLPYLKRNLSSRNITLKEFMVFPNV